MNLDTLALPLSDFIEVGFFDEHEQLFFLKNHEVITSNNQLSVVLDELPHKVVFDPNLLLVEKEVGDNEYFLR